MKAPVLFLIDELEVGGSQRQILILARALVQAGHAVTVGYFRARGAEMIGDLEAAGATVRLVAKTRAIDPAFVMRLGRFLGEDRQRRVLSFGYTANLWSRIAGTLARAPKQVSCIRNFGYLPRSDGAIGPIMARLERLLARRSLRVVANSRATADALTAKGCIPRDKMLVIPNAVEPEPPAPRAEARARLRAIAGGGGNGAGDWPIVGTLARLVEPKDLPTLLRAARHVVDRRGEVRFVIGGEGPLRPLLETLRRELGLDERVFFPGTLVGREVIAGLDVAVLSSSSEGMPNFVLEAMAAGVPIASTRAGAAPELLDEGALGKLAPIGDHAALGDAILAQLADPAGARVAAARAAQKARTLTAANIAAAYLALFDRA
ncbi:MAG TPA: glycosyltransferase [Polyangia bacterium]|jgi:glycosyltransferase involved in cell wall biosynthesis